MPQELKIQHIDGAILSGNVDYYHVDDISCKWYLVFTSSVVKKFTTVNSDLFECLVDLRQELAKYSYRPLCNGARKDVYPSRMCREMAGGISAYIMRFGQPAKLEDIVDIFDYSEPSLIASVEEQLVFYESWIRPNGKNAPSEKHLRVQDQDGDIIEAKLFVYNNSNPPKIILELPSELIFECTGIHFFECLLNLRKKLAINGLTPLCNGARIDNYVFLTEIEGFKGRVSHNLVLKKIPTQKDEMHIFEYADPFLVGSVDEQLCFYESWLRTIKSIPISNYQAYGLSNFPELYFRLIQIGDLMKMWIFDIDVNVEDEAHQELNLNRALSPLSPEDVNRIGELKSEAIVGFVSNYPFDLDTFTPNKLFVNFMQQIIANNAPNDLLLQEEATKQQEGWIYIIDGRESETEDPSSEDIIGAFEVKDGRIIVDSYYPNENYNIFGKRGLFQLSPFLSTALLEALKTL
jgi:hypothetical protein